MLTPVKSICLGLFYLLGLSLAAQEGSADISAPFNLGGLTPIKTLMTDGNGLTSIVLAARVKDGVEQEVEYYDIYQPLSDDNIYDPSTRNERPIELRTMIKGFALIKASKHENSISMLEINSWVGENLFEATNIISFANQLFVLGNLSPYDKKRRAYLGSHTNVVLIPVDENTFRVKYDERISIAKFKHNPWKPTGLHYYGFRCSQDGTKLGFAVFGSILKNESNSTTYCVFDDNLNQLFSKEIQVKSDTMQSMFRMDDFIVSNSGDIIEVGNYYPGITSLKKLKSTVINKAIKGKKPRISVVRRVSKFKFNETVLNRKNEKFQKIHQTVDGSIVLVYYNEKFESSALDSVKIGLINLNNNGRVVSEDNYYIPYNLFSLNHNKKLNMHYFINCNFIHKVTDESLILALNQHTMDARDVLQEQIIEQNTVFLSLSRNNIEWSASFPRYVPIKSKSTTIVSVNQNELIFLHKDTKSPRPSFYKLSEERIKPYSVSYSGEVNEMREIDFNVDEFSSLCYRASSDLDCGRSALILTSEGYRCVWIKK